MLTHRFIHDNKQQAVQAMADAYVTADGLNSTDAVAQAVADVEGTAHQLTVLARHCGDRYQQAATPQEWMEAVLRAGVRHWRLDRENERRRSN